MRGTVTLVLGGARSGKSAWAEEVAVGSGRRVLYVATATAGDDEMADRIAAHRALRPMDWGTVEAPLDLAATVRTVAGRGDAVLVDCLTLWVSNVVLERPAIGDGPARAGDHGGVSSL
ncbi:MAG: bifunctional adenosylcobinamide kinase/adenosylcobinamide-phosphate guanylyltransferase [Chloroflexota bacterium]|nr:bifunctional adenosylcobinamide kinase/adenosylcobinamide-phosphate guanylyltransferase [Chloroflexota bacterium]